MLNKTIGNIINRVVTNSYPEKSKAVPENLRGRPEVILESCSGAGECARACPTGAISLNPWRIDLGKCVFCGQCAEVCPSKAIKLTHDFELAARKREDLVVGPKGEPVEAELARATALQPAGTAANYPPRLLQPPEEQSQEAAELAGPNPAPAIPQSLPLPLLTLSPKRRALPMSLTNPGSEGDLEVMENHLKERIGRLLQRSLHIRHLDSGSCNGCDWELTTLLGPVQDIQRLGLDFVASPRHADLLLVTGVMTRNLTIAAIRTYRAMPEPRLVVAVGACGCSGGVFTTNYAGGGGTDTVLPVDVYIPGCPPRPQALIHGLLLATGRLEQHKKENLKAGS